MKILLMVPLTYFVEHPPNIPDLGLAYITSSLKNHGYDVYIRDWNADTSIENFRKWLNENQPEIVGIKVFTKDVAAAQKTIAIIRETLHETTIVIGGPHPSASEPEDLMDDFIDCDFAIRGEAEESLPSLLSEIKNSGDKDTKPVGERYKNVPGLVWLEEGNVFSNPISLVHNLDNIDFPCWEMFNPKDYSVNMLGSTLKEGYTSPIITTRGCPGKCSFCCAYNINGRKIRYRSPSNVLKEMSLLYNKYNVKKFMFMDNCFTSNKENLINICEGILNEKMVIEWDFVSYEKLDNLTGSTLSLMYRSGCRLIHMGIESGSEKTRRVMNKSCSLKEITEKIKVIQDTGVKVGAWFMIGFPEETKKEIRETTDYAFSVGVDMMQFSTCFPIPGSQVYHYIKGKYKFLKMDWGAFNIYDSIYPISQLSSKELKKIYRIIRFRVLMGRAFNKIMHIMRRK